MLEGVLLRLRFRLNVDDRESAGIGDCAALVHQGGRTAPNLKASIMAGIAVQLMRSGSLSERPMRGFANPRPGKALSGRMWFKGLAT